jgi:hypothetical protein
MARDGIGVFSGQLRRLLIKKGMNTMKVWHALVLFIVLVAGMGFLLGESCTHAKYRHCVEGK